MPQRFFDITCRISVLIEDVHGVRTSVRPRVFLWKPDQPAAGSPRRVPASVQCGSARLVQTTSVHEPPPNSIGAPRWYHSISPISLGFKRRISDFISDPRI